jgi:hypothetical protein
MGLLDKLKTAGSQLSKYDGATPPPSNIDVKGSTLHNQYSINGNPNMVGFPKPSLLDLNGNTPSVSSANPKQKLPYLNNLPK